MIRTNNQASMMMRQIEEMEEGQAKETMKKDFAEAFLQKRKEKEDQRSRASSRSRKFDFHAKSNWNLFATTLPSYEINTMPLLETDQKKR